MTYQLSQLSDLLREFSFFLFFYFFPFFFFFLFFFSLFFHRRLICTFRLNNVQLELNSANTSDRHWWCWLEIFSHRLWKPTDQQTPTYLFVCQDNKLHSHTVDLASFLILFVSEAFKCIPLPFFFLLFETEADVRCESAELPDHTQGKLNTIWAGETQKLVGFTESGSLRGEKMFLLPFFIDLLLPFLLILFVLFVFI